MCVGLCVYIYISLHQKLQIQNNVSTCFYFKKKMFVLILNFSSPGISLAYHFLCCMHLGAVNVFSRGDFPLCRRVCSQLQKFHISSKTKKSIVYIFLSLVLISQKLYKSSVSHIVNNICCRLCYLWVLCSSGQLLFCLPAHPPPTVSRGKIVKKIYNKRTMSHKWFTHQAKPQLSWYYAVTVSVVLGYSISEF